VSFLGATLRWREISNSQRPGQLNVAVLASFTLDPLVPYLGVELDKAGLAARISVGPYQQIVQECLSDRSSTAQLAPQVLIAWARFEELWRGQPVPLTDPISRYRESAMEQLEILIEACRRWRSTLLYVLPAIPELSPLGIGDALNPTGVFSTATQIRETLRTRLIQEQGALILDAERILRDLGSERSYDERLNALAHIPYTNLFFERVAVGLTRVIAMDRRAAKKVVVVDADNTLWGGVVGEVGTAGIDLHSNGPGEAYRSFQTFLLQLRRAGMLLALCSKNTEQDVWEVFARTDMVLRPEHLSAWRINWQPKAQNIEEIARELGLGLDSCVFIDDDPVQIGEVQRAHAEVACLRMPADPCNWMAMVKDTDVFDRFPPTPEDGVRAHHQDAEKQRANLMRVSQTLDEYRASLNVEVAICPAAETDVERLTQLIQKTNQFNLNCRRRSRREVSELLQNDRFLIRLVRATDRFGDYGIVGAFVIWSESDRATLDTFLLSCRAIGRGIEDAMLACCQELIGSPRQLLATLEECPRNEPARMFFARYGLSSCGALTRLEAAAWPGHIKRKLATHEDVERGDPGVSMRE